MEPLTVTIEGIHAKIIGTTYFRDETLTIAVLTLENGFKVVGTAACADPRKFDANIGQQLAQADAIRQVWALEGYLLREYIHNTL